jgi:hypothetical protein
MLICGIDPGKTGGVAFVSLQGSDAEVFDMPALPDLVSILKERQSSILRVFIEKQQVFKGQGIVSSGNLMKHYGEILGVLTALSIPFEEIPPKRWQAVIHGGKHSKKSRKEKKQASIQKAKQMFPELEIGKKDGRAEALLIAEYGRRLLCFAG